MMLDFVLERYFVVHTKPGLEKKGKTEKAGFSAKELEQYQ